MIGDLYDMSTSTSTRSHFYPITHDEKKEQKTKEKEKIKEYSHPLWLGPGSLVHNFSFSFDAFIFSMTRKRGEHILFKSKTRA